MLSERLFPGDFAKVFYSQDPVPSGTPTNGENGYIPKIPEGRKGFVVKPSKEIAESERFVSRISVITVSGRSGTGKSETSKKLAQFIADSTRRGVAFYKIGEQIVRRDVMERKGEEVIGDQDRSPQYDEVIEAFQREVIRESTPKNPVILEGWLSGVALREQRARENVEGVSILFVARNDIRFARGLGRARRKNSNITRKQYERETKKREGGNSDRWSLLHPQIKGIDPWGPQNKDNTEEPIYDFCVNTNYLTTDEVAQSIFDWLVKSGYLVSVSGEKKNSLPARGDIFQQGHPAA